MAGHRGGSVEASSSRVCARRTSAFAVKRCNEAKCGKKDFFPPKRDENGRVSGAQLEGGREG